MPSSIKNKAKNKKPWSISLHQGNQESTSTLHQIIQILDLKLDNQASELPFPGLLVYGPSMDIALV